MLSSFLTYTWFVIITLTPKIYTFSIISILVFIYLFNDLDKHFRILTPQNKFILFSSLFFTTLLISIIGCYKYYNIKQQKFGNKFNISKFFFGKIRVKTSVHYILFYILSRFKKYKTL